jgi:uncharacterized membrane protein HdeD (DUF308 family)
MSELGATLKEIRRDIKNWWVFLIIGAVFVLLGFWVMSKPLESYLALSILFAITMLIGGIFQIVFSITNREEMKGWGWQLAVGIMELILGIILTRNMGLTMTTLPFVVGFWMMFRSMDLIGIALELQTRKYSGWVWYLVLGILLMIFAWFIIFNPILGGITVVLWTSFALIVAGVTYIMLAFKFKKVNQVIEKVEEKI